jgi:hypothetical protein
MRDDGVNHDDWISVEYGVSSSSGNCYIMG